MFFLYCGQYEATTQFCRALIHSNYLENKQPWIFTLAVPSKMFQGSGIQNPLDPLQSPFDTEPKFNYPGWYGPAS